MPGIEVRAIHILPSTLLALIGVKWPVHVDVLQMGIQHMVDGLFNQDSSIRLASIR